VVHSLMGHELGANLLVKLTLVGVQAALFLDVCVHYARNSAAIRHRDME
jgi:hypothetical protein